MYNCRKCKTPINDSDRYCSGCGAYIGEPARKRDYWDEEDYNETQEDSSSNVIKKSMDNIHISSVKFLNQVLRKVMLSIRFPLSTPISAVDKITLKELRTLTAVFILAVPILLSLLIKYSLPIPNDLIDIILPTNLFGSDFKGLLNLPKEFSLGLIYSFCGFILTLVLLYLIIYLSARVIFNSWISPRKLWKTVVIAVVPYTLNLLLYFILSLISRVAANIYLLFGTIAWIVIVFNVFNCLFNNQRDKVLFLVAGSFSAAYLVIYGFFYAFMR